MLNDLETLHQRVTQQYGAHLVDVDPEIRANALLYGLNKKRPGSPEWVYQTIALAKQDDRTQSLTQVELVNKIRTLLDVRAWETVPTKEPYGSPLKLIATEFGFDDDVAANLIHKAGGNVTENRFQKADLTRQRVLSLNDGTRTQQQIADEVGVTQPRAAQIINEMSNFYIPLISTAIQQAEKTGVTRQTLYNRTKRLEYLKENAPELWEQALDDPDQINALYRQAQQHTGDLLLQGINNAVRAIMKLPEEGQEAVLARIFRLRGGDEYSQEAVEAPINVEAPDDAPDEAPDEALVEAALWLLDAGPNNDGAKVCDASTAIAISKMPREERSQALLKLVDDDGFTVTQVAQAFIAAGRSLQSQNKGYSNLVSAKTSVGNLVNKARRAEGAAFS